MARPHDQHAPRIPWCGAMAAVLALLLVLLTPTATQSHATAVAELPPRFVMIGDSYAYSTLKPLPGDDQHSWPELVGSEFVESPTACTIYRRRGLGFARAGRHFIELLEGASCDPTVTDVLIVGGAGNDRWSSEDRILTWYGTTIDRLRALYPNATIMHAITSWDLNDAWYRERLELHIPCYQKAAAQHGVIYLHGCESVMRNRPECFLSDGRHPNSLGQEAISAVIIDAIRRLNPRYAS